VVHAPVETGDAGAVSSPGSVSEPESSPVSATGTDGRRHEEQQPGQRPPPRPADPGQHEYRESGQNMCALPMDWIEVMTTLFLSSRPAGTQNSVSALLPR